MALDRIDEDEDDFEGDFDDINVTPFIDVALVLLIIFMVAAPLATVPIPVTLPSISATAEPPNRDPVTIVLRGDLSITVGEQSVVADQLAATLDAATRSDHEAWIHVVADKAVAYGDLMDLMGRLKRAGYFKVVLVAQDGGGRT